MKWVDELSEMQPVPSVRDAIRTAEAYTEGTLAIEQTLRSDPAFVPVLDELRDAMLGRRKFSMSDRRRVIAQTGEDGFVKLSLIVKTAQAVRLWQHHRVIYRLHPELQTGLSDTGTDIAVPCEVFGELPHPDPYVAFPVALPSTPTPGGPELAEQPTYTGMLVTGLDAADQPCSTHSPQVKRLNIALGGPLRYVGQETTYEEREIVVPLSGTVSIEQMLEQMTYYIAPGQERDQDAMLEAYKLQR